MNMMQYIVIKRLVDKANKRIGFVVQINDGIIRNFKDKEFIKILSRENVKSNIGYNNSGAFMLEKGKKIEDLPIEYIRDISSNVLVGNQLTELVNSVSYKKRFIFKDLMLYLQEPTNRKVCCLYGLRRTGKTILMYQAIQELLKERKKVALITLNETDALCLVYKDIDTLVNKGYRYIFLDEITYVDGFLQSCSKLADIYASRGIHIVLDGTDTYILRLAELGNLYDRMIRINTTYISYKETKYLGLVNSVFEYMQLGGILPKDIFYSVQKTEEYVNTAITENLILSFRRANNKKAFSHLLDLDSRGLLKRSIELAIIKENEKLLVDLITNMYKNEELGSAMQKLEHIFEYKTSLDISSIEDGVRYLLNIVKEDKSEFNQDYITELCDYLVEINVMKYYKRYIGRINSEEVPLFIQPGLRYNQTMCLLKYLRNNDSFIDLDIELQKALETKIKEGIEGSLLESIILIDTMERYGTDKVTQINIDGKEFDMVFVTDNGLEVYEIKRSNKMVENQCRWLIDKEFCNKVEKRLCDRIIKKSVLYNGKTKDIIINNEKIHYLNIEEYLLR